MNQLIQHADHRIIKLMHLSGHACLRLSLAIVFIWFGILKPLGISAAEPLVLMTIDWMPLLTAKQWLAVIGWWEVTIGILFLFPRTTRIAIALLAMQMAGTLMPLFILPDVTFQTGRIPFAPTMEGQYIIKNLLIISAAIVIGGSIDKHRSSN